MSGLPQKRIGVIIIAVAMNLGLHGQSRTFKLPGLSQEVEIIVDHWGIPHIYAQTEADLFFAQGFYAAKDRLFQFEIWRRQATGTVAEILGARELKRDIGTRLFMFRGDIQREMNHYHQRGALIISSFVAGVNAYIDLALKNPDQLPIPFQLLGIQPKKWTPEVVISRHQGLLGNIGAELNFGRLVATIGPEKVKELAYFHPQEPLLELDSKIDKQLLFEDLLELYDAFRRPVRFQPEDIISDARTTDWKRYEKLAEADRIQQQANELAELWNVGSNNWVINGQHTQSGYPIMANDPHRTLAVPSLRYMAHLVAPGWNVIGGGEPEIPGISIGHNEHGAWGLTVFRTDAEDLYIYKTNPEDPYQYWYRGAWENMRLIEETIAVKGGQPVTVELKYTRHGPVVFEDQKKNQACAVRCGWMEIGGSPYLASLRMDQATTFEEFREACNYSHIPGENMIWADKAGNIGWQAVGIAPIRRNWSGLVPVPGDGTYEWEGYLPIIAKPHLFNPDNGIFATANENVTPQSYLHMDAIGYTWSDPYRGNRVREYLLSGKKHSLMDMAKLQTDYLSLPARNLVPLLRSIAIDDEQLRMLRDYLLNWNYELTPTSTAAAIYDTWEERLVVNMNELMVPKAARQYLRLQMTKIINWLILPDGKFGEDPIQGRDDLLVKSLKEADAILSNKLGADPNQWQYGGKDYKHVYVRHPLSLAVNENRRRQLDVGPVPRGGNSYSVNNTSGNDNQSHGATFRLIVDTGNWDHCLGTNAPGQAGDPNDKHYRNLFEIWAKDRYFPVFYSREKVESVGEERLILRP